MYHTTTQKYKIMATRSMIGIKNEDGTVNAIYCHNDGYLDHVGRTLHNYYHSKEKASSLIALGSLSSLGKYIAPITDLARGQYDYTGEEDLVRHSFDTPHKDTTVAYHRDRGEFHRSYDYDSAADFFTEDRADGHLYLFDSDKWLYNDRSLGEVLTEEAEK